MYSEASPPVVMTFKLLVLSSVLVLCRSTSVHMVGFTFLFKTSCTKELLSKEKTRIFSCAAACGKEAFCVGFQWSPDSRQCQLVRKFLKTSNSTGRCRYYQKNHTDTSHSRCGKDFNIAVGTTPGRVFRLGKTRVNVKAASDECKANGGELASLHEDRAVDEIPRYIFKVFFSRDLSYCDEGPHGNFHCRILIGARTLDNGEDQWINSEQPFAPIKAKFGFPSDKECKTFYVIKIRMDPTGTYEDTKLMCAKSLSKVYNTLCQCRV